VDEHKNWVKLNRLQRNKSGEPVKAVSAAVAAAMAVYLFFSAAAAAAVVATHTSLYW
jgi:putative NIF3 family GTP cyclohydrolase 1 type 2